MDEAFSSVLFYLITGDTRVAETPGLTTMHNMFVRYHNYIAKKLRRLNKHWKNNKVFFEVSHMYHF